MADAPPATTLSNAAETQASATVAPKRLPTPATRIAGADGVACTIGTPNTSPPITPGLPMRGLRAAAKRRRSSRYRCRVTTSAGPSAEGPDGVTIADELVMLHTLPHEMRRRGRDERVRPAACAAIASVLLAAGVLAGCGGAHASSSTSFRSRAVAYANCMRSHGVPDFPDPNSQGHLVISPSGPISDLRPDSPAFTSALKACGPLPSDVTPAQEHQEYLKSVKAAICMRTNGVPNYPDPKLIDGTIDHNFNPDLNISPSSPAFERAAKKCGHGQPGLVGPG